VSSRPAAPERLAVGGVDLIAVVVTHLLAVASFRAAFAGSDFLVAGAAGTFAAALYWMWALRAPIPTWFRFAGAVVVFAVVGPLATVRGHGVRGFLPTPRAAGTVFSGSVHGWWTLLTTLPPVGAVGHALVVPYLCGFVGVSASLLLLRATRAPLLAAVPPIVILGAGVLVGTDRAGSLYVEAGLLVAAVLLWASTLHRRTRRVLGTVRRLRGRGLAGVVALLVVVALGAGALGSHVPFVQARSRFVLRDHVQPPFDATQYPSPLAGYRKYRVAKTRSAALFTVDGVHAKTRLRVAVMDDYDGLVWRVADNGNLDAFRRAGTKLPDASHGTVENLDVTIQGLQGVWLPTVGDPLGITFTGANANRLASRLRYNVAQSTAAVRGGLHRGDTFTIRTSVDAGQPNLDGTTIAPQPATSAPAIFAPFADQAGTIGNGATDARSQAAAIATAFRQGYYDDGPTENTPPGHFLARINAFLREKAPVGNSEQYAAAAAILLRARQVPARVVLGLTLEPKRRQYRFGDMTAWVEIPVAGKGWVAYDVTPATDRRPPPQPEARQRVAGPQPPPQPPHGALSANSGAVGSAESRTKPSNQLSNSHKPERGGAARILAWLLIAAIPVAIFLAPIVLILGLKRRRRIRRRRAATPAERIAGGWDEVVDYLRDLGRPVPPATTRRELAITAISLGIGDFASRVDASVFGAREPTNDDARALWKEATATCRRLVHSVGPFARVRCALNVTSLRAVR
jgi:transglutaminase-like putative cysteine protease